jgi:hypothetical protein
MNDGKRKVVNALAVINKGIIHHSAGIEYLGKDPDYVFDQLNNTGFARGYAPNGYDFMTGYSKEYGQNYHKHTKENGESVISYCEYHYAIYQYSQEESQDAEPDLNNPGASIKKIIKPAVYKIVSLIDDPVWNDAGSCGLQNLGETYADYIKRARSWNEDALAFVFCGNWEVNPIPESMVEAFIAAFGNGQPFEWILQKNYQLKFFGHKDSKDATQCPGKYLYTYINRIQREIELSLKYL